MKRSLSVFLAVLVCAAAAFAADEGRFFTYPTISGDRIAFTYESDLWTAPAKGGVATRLTTFPGTESFAKFSPDGRWLAFTATYDGAPAVYLMPSEGGAPVRLTYNPGGAQVVAWTPDGTEVVFRSMFENVVGRDPNLYSVGVKGGAPVRLPLERGVLISFIPEKHQFLYCRRGNEEYYWKRYKGGQYQDIWLYDAAAKTYTPVTDYVGKNSYPMWAGGLMHFVSDRGNGIANLYAQKLGTKDVTPVTKYADFDVMFPNTDGRSIVYVQDGRLHVLDVASGTDARISVKVPSDRWALRDRVINPRDYIHAAGVGNGGAAVVLAARGDVFRVPAGAGPAENLSGTPGTREIHPALSPDGKTVAFFSDKGGDYQLYTQPAAGGEWTQVTTTLDRAVYKLALVARREEDPLREQGLRRLLGRPRDQEAGQGRFLQPDEERRIHLGDRRLRLVARLQVDRLQLRPDEPQQPDLRLQHRDREEGRRRRPISTTTSTRPSTPTATTSTTSRAGTSTCSWTSTRTTTSWPRPSRSWPSSSGPARPRRSPENRWRRAGRRRPPCPSGSTRTAWSSGPSLCPSPPGNYFWLKAGPGKVLWASIDAFTEGEYEDIFRNKYGATQVDAAHLRHGRPQGRGPRRQGPGLLLSPDGGTLLVRREGDFFTTAVDKAFASKAAGDKVDLSGLVYRVDLQKEWHQIFNDAWRWYRDFFYDAGFHGRDWKAMGDKYRAYIPRAVLAGRAQLGPVPDGRRAVRLPHLCRRRRLRPRRDAPVARLHGPARGRPRPRQGLGPLQAGQDLRPDRRQPQPDRAARPARHRREGRGLPPGHRRDAAQGRRRLFQASPDDGRAGRSRSRSTPRRSRTGAKTYEVEPVRSDAQMRYFRWIDDNIKAIDKATGGRVGYMHINAMGGGGIGEFDKYWRAFRYKEGVIIDVRRNGGGWTEYFLIDKLERELVAYNNLRDMVPFRYPGSAGNGNYVVISNENNGSDGEAFVEHFKARKLGTVVGRPVVGRPGRHPQPAADHRQRHGRAVEQRLLRPRREVAGREPRGRPGHPGRQ